MQGNVNHLLSRCGEAGERRKKKSMRKYEEQPAREPEHQAERTRERQQLRDRKDRQREKEREFMQVQNKEKERESVEKKRETDGESDNKWNDAPCEGLPRVHSATWNYSTRKRLGRLLIEASGLADFPVREMPYPIGCGGTAL